jgi:ubiquinone/menaquinone biosynthesis C-methylase UbiE
MSGAPFPLRDELRLVRALLAPERGGLVLDVACSTGLYARACAAVAPQATVVAVDHSTAMLRETQRYARRAGLRISCVRAAAQALPFRSGAATAYGMGGSLNEIGDIAGMLAEVRRVLSDDGRFVSMH